MALSSTLSSTRLQHVLLATSSKRQALRRPSLYKQTSYQSTAFREVRSSLQTQAFHRPLLVPGLWYGTVAVAAIYSLVKDIEWMGYMAFVASLFGNALSAISEEPVKDKRVKDCDELMIQRISEDDSSVGLKRVYTYGDIRNFKLSLSAKDAIWARLPTILGSNMNISSSELSTFIIKEYNLDENSCLEFGTVVSSSELRSFSMLNTDVLPLIKKYGTIWFRVL